MLHSKRLIKRDGLKKSFFHLVEVGQLWSLSTFFCSWFILDSRGSYKKEITLIRWKDLFGSSKQRKKVLFWSGFDLIWGSILVPFLRISLKFQLYQLCKWNLLSFWTKFLRLCFWVAKNNFINNNHWDIKW